jgi:hypothetical protein
MTKLIVDLFEDESLVKNLVQMLSTFVLQVAKKDNSLYHSTKYASTFAFIF